MRLALGTVQFGLNYGIANNSGQVPQEEIGLILATARGKGIDVLDTAIAYGESESRLGVSGVDDFRIISKLPKVDDPDAMAAMVRAALERLGIKKLAGLLLHRSDDISGPNGSTVHAALVDLKRAGLVEKIGVSIYDPAELDRIDPALAIDLVQAPFNVLDQRLITSGWLTRLKALNVEVHTRSALLQGLLLMAPDARPAYFSQWPDVWRLWDGWLAETGTNPLEGAIGFALAQNGIDRVIVGVDSDRQLRDILAATLGSAPIPPAALAMEDVNLINPAYWNPK